MIRAQRSVFYLLFPVFFSVLLISCKSPIPVYFNTPIGVKVQGFDTSIAGNYIPLEEVIEKGTKEFSEKYKINYDKIQLKDRADSSAATGKEINYEEVKNIIGIKKDTARKEKAIDCDSLFNTLTAYNTLMAVTLTSRLDKKLPVKLKAGMINISYDRIMFIQADSLGNNFRDTLITLGTSVLLTKYSGRYFLNFKTLLGWEILQLDVWENKFLSVRPFYFTGYNDCTKSISELTASTAAIYPDLKPVLNKEKKVIGFKAVMDAKLLLEKFKRSESTVLLLKIK